MVLKFGVIFFLNILLVYKHLNYNIFSTVKDIFKDRAKLKEKSSLSSFTTAVSKVQEKTSIYIPNQDQIWHVMCSRYSTAKTWF